MRKMPNISSPYRSFNITFWKIVDFLSNFGVPWGRPPSLNRVDIGVKKVVHWPQKLNTENPEWIGPIATNWCVFLRKCVSLSTLEVSGGTPPLGQSGWKWCQKLRIIPKNWMQKTPSRSDNMHLFCAPLFANCLKRRRKIKKPCFLQPGDIHRRWKGELLPLLFFYQEVRTVSQGKDVNKFK